MFSSRLGPWKFWGSGLRFGAWGLGFRVAGFEACMMLLWIALSSTASRAAFPERSGGCLKGGSGTEVSRLS